MPQTTFVEQDWIDKIAGDKEQLIEDAVVDYRNKNILIPCEFKNMTGLNRDEPVNALNFYYRMVIRQTRILQYRDDDSLIYSMQTLLRKKYP